MCDKKEEQRSRRVSGAGLEGKSSAENRRLLSSTCAFHFDAPHRCNVCNLRMNLVEHYDGFFSSLPMPTVEIYESYKCLKLIWIFSLLRDQRWERIVPATKYIKIVDIAVNLTLTFNYSEQ